MPAQCLKIKTDTLSKEALKQPLTALGHTKGGHALARTLATIKQALKQALSDLSDAKGKLKLAPPRPIQTILLHVLSLLIPGLALPLAGLFKLTCLRFGDLQPSLSRPSLSKF